MASQTNPKDHLVEGTTRHLDPILVPAGFRFAVEREGPSSNGPYSSGAYTSGDWRLDLNVRYRLGLIRLSHGEKSVDLGSYLRIVGGWSEAEFPRSQGGLDAFAALGADLKSYCADFLTRRVDEFGSVVERAERMNSEPRRLP